MTARQRAIENPASLDALLEGLIDYAGLFPPASESMRAAAERYAEYLDSADSRALARFIVPVNRLGELESLASDLIPGPPQSKPWRLAALVSGDASAAAREILDFNQRYSVGSRARAEIDVVEMKANDASEISAHHRALPRNLTTYFEIPTGGDLRQLVAAIAATGARAKIRTGGVTADAFPAAEVILDFMTACMDAGVPFKATAGLHHPLRGEYRLTYAPGSPRATMYGYLNVFLAAALLRVGAPRDVALAALLETDPRSLDFGDDCITWRDRKLTTRQLHSVREFAISFGSCSFREPIDELAQLTRTS
ncbi:MAG TPA: hypothetical protein VJ825_12575 [Gemmatimonadaceae bacterium]|nr:hypothetical protein [Gemmatimonadaceae bacterium]